MAQGQRIPKGIKEFPSKPKDFKGNQWISKETKGRKGSGVTIVKGVKGSPSELKQIARNLKSQCGVGGTVKDGVIEIQGDQRQLIRDIFETTGEKVKLVGG